MKAKKEVKKKSEFQILVDLLARHGINFNEEEKKELGLE